MKFDRQLRPATETSWVVSYGGKTIPRWRTAAILKIVISLGLYRHISVKNHPISMTFCTQQQILDWMNVTWSKMKKSCIGQTPSSTERIFVTIYTVSIRAYIGLPPTFPLPCETRKSKNVTELDSVLNKLLTCSWGHFEDLIYYLKVVRQTVSRLLALTDWLTFEVCRTVGYTSRINSSTLFSWTLLHHGDFFTMIIFAPSSFFLGYI